MKINLDPFAKFCFATLLLSGIIIFFMPPLYFAADVHWWIEWSKYIQQHGFSAAYTDPVINYQPGLLYLLQVYVWMCPTSIETSIPILKSLIFVFDVGSVLLAAYILQRYRRSPYWSWLILLNPAFLYTTLMWGQVDSMYMFFCFLTLVLIIFEKPYWAIAAFGFSLMMKPQAIFLGPLLLLIYSGWLWESKVRIIKSTFTFLLSILLIATPFIIHGQGMNLIEITFGAIDRVPAVSMHAYNLWHLIFYGEDLVWMPDSSLFLGISLRTWGMILFFIALIFTLKPFVKYIKRSAFSSKEELIKMGPTILLGAATVNLVFYYFNTQMHERYIHAAILLVGTASIINKNYWTYILLSLAYFLSLDILMHHCRFPEVIYRAPLPYHPGFIAILFLITLILLWKELKCFASPFSLNDSNQ